MRQLAVVIALLVGTYTVCVQGEYKHARATAEDRTILDDYIAKDDPSFSWTELVDERIDDFPFSTLYFLNVTSQTWLDDDFSTQSVWWHYLVVAVPYDLVYTDSAAMFIGGGSNSNLNPPIPDEDPLSLVIQLYAEMTGSVTVYLKQIPNQPIVFKDDPEQKRRSEDSMIAYTWKQFVDNPDFNPEGIARLPMTKAVVRAMDAVTEFVQEEEGFNIEKYVVGGGSKRGWTTWTAAAVDNRIIAQAPMVLTCLNFTGNLHKHYQSLGGWSFALGDYYTEGLTADIDEPRIQELMDIVDPYAYMSRYTIPTMVVAATGDQFFLPDDTWFFYDELPGVKLLLMSPNSDHSLVPWVDVYANFMSFYIGVVTPGYQFPVTSSERIFTETGGRVEFRTDVIPRTVTVYYALTPDPSRRDFRANIGADAEESDVFWDVDDAQDQGDGLYVAEYDDPIEGWLGFLIEAVYDGPEGEELILTSEVQIIPNVYPFADCVGEDCYGTIV